MKVGDLSFLLHERPSLAEDDSNQLTLPSGITYTTFTNDFGLSAFWDLNALQIQAGFNRSDSIPLGSSTKSTNSSSTENSAQHQRASENLVNSLQHSTDTLQASATLHITDMTSAGLEA